ncbi:AMP-binding protein [Nocardia sp. bgisy118]|uniref:AMP-binding protein n=1 Tax=Nocardia sp. bgisy118 TaxID=3413786 RepID=UPI003F4A0F3D
MSSYMDMNTLLRTRAEVDPDGITYTFLDEFDDSGAWRERSVTNAQLVTRAMALATRIQRHAVPGDRVLILQDPGLDYVVAVYGSMLAGAVAVPIYPPEPGRLNRSVERIATIAANARPTCVLVDPAASTALRESSRLGNLAGIPWVDTAAITEEGAAEQWHDPGCRRDELALLQYTSGSTGDPKGVMLTHAGLLSNLEYIADVYRLADRMNAVFWLPPYHDMGLIGGIYSALYSGGRLQSMAPSSFLSDPMRWIRAMSHYGAMGTAAPNFAYEVCAEIALADPRGIAELDLSAVDVLISGAEPVRAQTMATFLRAFAPAGLREDAFYPSYGLAENTLLVSANHGATSKLRLDPVRLEQNEAVETESDEHRLVIGCGPVSDPRQQVLIVDPDTRLPLEPGSIGEIWIRTASVGQGYWGRPQVSDEVFRAHPADAIDDDTFLSTGDLGFVHNGELFVTGRRKELIILRGRNHYPHDIERTAGEAHDAVHYARCAAFSVPGDGDGDEGLVLAVQVASSVPDFQREEIAEKIRDRIGELHGVPVSDIYFLPRGGLKRTSSGKVRRSAIRADYLAQQPVHDRTTSVPYLAPRDEVEQAVAEAWSAILQIPRVGVHDRFFELGGDSLKAARLLERLRVHNRIELSLSEISTVHTVAEFADLVRGKDDMTAVSAEVHVEL